MIDLMRFTADIAREIGTRNVRVTKLTTSERDEPQYPHCYHVRVEDGARWAEYWVTHAIYGESAPIDPIVDSLLYRLKHGDPVTVHVPERIVRKRVAAHAAQRAPASRGDDARARGGA